MEKKNKFLNFFKIKKNTSKSIIVLYFLCSMLAVFFGGFLGCFIAGILGASFGALFGYVFVWMLYF